jgi:hypothetical protein
VVRSIAPDIDDESIMRMVARCDGLPFVLEEQARALREKSTGAFAETGELSMFLAARLDELGPRLRRLIGEIAVAGEEVRLDVVRRLSDLEPAELDQLIADLCRQRVLLRLNGPSGEWVRFRHALLCDAAYDSLLEIRRASLHGRVADILTDLSPAAAAEDIAHHYEVAGTHKNAAEWWLQAARNSANTGALVEAISQFRRSLSALTYLPDNAARVALKLDVQFRLGDRALDSNGLHVAGSAGCFPAGCETGREPRGLHPHLRRAVGNVDLLVRARRARQGRTAGEPLPAHRPDGGSRSALQVDGGRHDRLSPAVPRATSRAHAPSSCSPASIGASIPCWTSRTTSRSPAGAR